MEHEHDSDTNCNCCAWNDPQSIGKGTRRLGNKRTRGNHPDYSIVKNTEKSPGNLRRVAATQIPVKDYQLTLV